MTLPWREHPEATDELLAAIRYYHRLQPGLGERLAAEVARSIDDILWNPEAWPAVSGWDRMPFLRNRKVAGFPYRVVYLVRANEIVIVAHAATAKRPSYWKDRVS